MIWHRSVLRGLLVLGRGLILRGHLIAGGRLILRGLSVLRGALIACYTLLLRGHAINRSALITRRNPSVSPRQQGRVGALWGRAPIDREGGQLGRGLDDLICAPEDAQGADEYMDRSARYTEPEESE